MLQHEPKLTWLILPIVSLLFFFADGHNLLRPVQEKGTIDQAARQVDEGRIERRVSLLCLLVLATVSLMRKDRRSFKINGVLGWLILFYLTWAFLSIAWAVDHRLTFRRLAILGIFSFSALAFAERFSLRSVIFWVFISTSFYLIAGIFAEVALECFQPFSPDYRFSGSLHPNQQGMNCVLLLFSALFLKNDAKRFRRVFLGFALTAIAFLILTKSRTSFAGAILALGLYFLVITPGSRKFLLFLGTGFTVCLLLLIVGHELFSVLRQAVLLGRSSDSEAVFTLTGRTLLWGECFEYLQQRLIQGYGYGGFWTPGHIAEISARRGWTISGSHSAYFEQALQLGIVGLLTYMLILTGVLIRSIKSMKKKDESGALFFMLLFSFCMINGLLESSVVWHRLIMFISVVGIVRFGFVYVSAKEI